MQAHRRPAKKLLHRNPNVPLRLDVTDKNRGQPDATII